MDPHYADDRTTIYLGDCRRVLPTLEPASVEAIVTDPPAGIAFMGHAWDGDRGGRRQWVDWMTGVMAEALRVAKPGAHAFVWALPRTSHWTAWALEDAGWEVRDCVYHLFGQGFPKSLDVGKQIDRAGRREYVLAAVRLGLRVPGNNLHDWTKAEHSPGDVWWEKFKAVLSPEDWQRVEREVIGRSRYSADRSAPGWLGAMSTPEGPRHLTAPATDDAKQWDGWGTALKPAAECWWLARKPLGAPNVARNVLEYGTGALNVRDGAAAGRWPPNVALDEGAAAELGTTSRYFYAPKPSASERQGLTHPTVKPVALLRWLCRLITPPGGVVLDLFAGTGSTRLAALAEGFRCVLIEQDAAYLDELCGRPAQQGLDLSA